MLIGLRRLVGAVALTAILATSLAHPASALGYTVGQGSSAPSRYIQAYNRNGGGAALGSPINAVHVWGRPSIQDFRGGTLGWGAILLKNDSALNNAYFVHGGIWESTRLSADHPQH